MAIDPVCEMEVDESTGLKVEKDGKTNYFCSHHCRKKFLEGETPVDLSTGTPARVEIDRLEHVGYFCPMCEGVSNDHPGNCPKCGMALEPATTGSIASRIVYTCPMHPEVEQDVPGNCPKCGMVLEPKEVQEEEDDTELRDMSKRFWVGCALSLPLLVIAMGGLIPGDPLARIIPHGTSKWVELLLATPVVLWAGWPFFQRGWRSVVTWNLNMFTLIALGTGMAVFLQPGCRALTEPFSRVISSRGEVGSLFRSSGL